MSGGFTHFDASGNAVMVDVSAKQATDRTATARAMVVMSAATLAMIEAGTAKKGDVLGVARIAGIMAAKRTSDLIPLCHPLPITAVVVDLTADRAANAIEIAATLFALHRANRRGDGGAGQAPVSPPRTVYYMCSRRSRHADRGFARRS